MRRRRRYVPLSFGPKVDLLPDVGAIEIAPTSDWASGEALSALIGKVGWKMVARGGEAAGQAGRRAAL